VPFVSIGHYSPLAALKHWNIDQGDLNETLLAED
jgi:ABC-type taurine transport system substrate-binding protein